MANKSGVIRINQDAWNHLTSMAIECSVRLHTPINQSTVLNAMLHDQIGDWGKAAIVEAVRKYTDQERV